MVQQYLNLPWADSFQELFMWAIGAAIAVIAFRAAEGWAEMEKGKLPVTVLYLGALLSALLVSSLWVGFHGKPDTLDIILEKKVLMNGGLALLVDPSICLENTPRARRLMRDEINCERDPVEFERRATAYRKYVEDLDFTRCAWVLASAALLGVRAGTRNRP